MRKALSFLQNDMLLLTMKPTEVKHQRPSKKTRRCFCMFFHFRIILQKVAVFLRDRRIPFVFWIWRQLNVGTGIKMPEVFTMYVWRGKLSILSDVLTRSREKENSKKQMATLLCVFLYLLHIDTKPKYSVRTFGLPTIFQPYWRVNTWSEGWG